MYSRYAQHRSLIVPSQFPCYALCRNKLRLAYSLFLEQPHVFESEDPWHLVPSFASKYYLSIDHSRSHPIASGVLPFASKLSHSHLGYFFLHPNSLIRIQSHPWYFFSHPYTLIYIQSHMRYFFSHPNTLICIQSHFGYLLYHLNTLIHIQSHPR